jgi:hypothetical protein
VSELVVSPEAQRFVRDLADAGHLPVARLFRNAGVNRRRAREVIAELVELAWIHRQRGRWELQPEGANAARWYATHTAGAPHGAGAVRP